jgi:fructose-1,6-bisphosphatase/inositol monophosphatase family enzyme
MDSILKFIINLKIRYLITGIFLIFFFWFIIDFLTTDFESANTITHKEKINLNELYTLASCLVVQAGKKIVEIRVNEKLNVNKKERDNSIITRADIESHNVLVHTLNKKYTNLKIYSEESSQDEKSIDSYLSICDKHVETKNDIFVNINDVVIYIDPLDATQEYSGFLNIFGFLFTF